jgi:hypothetical protein
MSGSGNYLNRPAQAKYLSERLGRRVTVSALHRMASDGTGPRYVMLLGQASSTAEWLEEWIEKLAQEPKKRPRRQESLNGQAEGSRQSAPAAASATAVAA